MMNLKRNTVLMLTLSAGIFLFAGCGATGGKSDSSESSQSMSVIAESEEQTGDCYVTITDGDDISEYPVKAYGEEFALPDYDTTKEGKFYGWLGFSGLYQPGDLVVAEEFMEFEALRSTPGAGTLALINPVHGGCSVMTTEEPSVELYSMDQYTMPDDSEDYFDYWTDDAGKKYENKDSVTLEKDQVVILTAVYSTDLSNAYKVTYNYNTEMDEEEHYRYVKKGSELSLAVSFEPAGVTFDGWYDNPEGGNLIAGDDEMFTPDADITIYAHWREV